LKLAQFSWKASQIFVTLFSSLIALVPPAIANADPVTFPLRLAQIFEPPPGQGAPGQTAGGGRRDAGRCEAIRLSEGVAAHQAVSRRSLTALIPNSNAGLTTAKQPSFFFYIPEVATQKAEFVLDTVENGKRKQVVAFQVALAGQPGVFKLTLPPDAPSLNVNQDYFWAFSILCQSQGTLRDPLVSGKVRRVQVDATLAAQLDQATALEKVSLYARSGIWYEAITQLASLRQTQPNDSQLSQAWQTLLQSVGLQDVATAPLLSAQ